MADPQSSRDGQSDLPVTVPELRASHADRDQVVELLRVAAGDGRLSPEELDDRLERALTARTYAELAALTADLPTTPGATTPPGTESATPKDLVRIHVHGSSVNRDGHWVVRLALVSPSSCASRSQARFTARVSPQGRPFPHADRDARSGNGCAAPRVPP
jgi:hypothetical protein